MNAEVSPKKARKPQLRSLHLREAILAVADEYERLTIRQLYYQLVSRGVIEKTEAAYDRVCDQSGQLRIGGALPYGKIVDEHRTRQIVGQWDGLTELLETAQHSYRRNYWTHQPYHVEVWCEKAALSGIIRPICDTYGVYFVALKGFGSHTIIYNTAQHIIWTGKPAIVLYFGDHDASGWSISRGLESKFRSHGAEVEVKRIALLPEHIEEYRLPTRPGKKSDSRQAGFAAEFGEASVELDALPPDALETMVDDGIYAEVDDDEWERVQRVEAMERETLKGWTDLLHTKKPNSSG